MRKYLLLIFELVAFLFVIQLFAFGLNVLLSLDLNNTFDMMIMEMAVFCIISLAAYLILRFWEKKPFSDLGLSFCGRWKDAFWGMLIAAGIYAVGFSISLLAGWVRVTDVAFLVGDVAVALLLMIFTALQEEVMNRGFVLGRMLNVGMNPFLAVLLSSVFFAMLHLSNPGITPLAVVNIVLAGILLGLPYVYTRNLTFSIVLHMFWNWIQNSVLGYAVSGLEFGESVFSIELSNHALMNGGEFGFEGSLPCTVLMIVAIGVVLKYVIPRLKQAESEKIINQDII